MYLNEKIYVSSSTYDIEIIKAKCNGVPIKLKDLINSDLSNIDKLRGFKFIRKD